VASEAAVNVITVAIVDDHRVVARSLKAYLETFPDLRVVGMAASGRICSSRSRRGVRRW